MSTASIPFPTRSSRWLLIATFPLLVAGCRALPCNPAGDKVAQLVGQLEGACCDFHTEPTEEQIDDSCKRHGMSSRGMRWMAGRHDCAKWAAECLGQMGDEAGPAVEALIAALDKGPNNYDTGDGIIPTRDAIARALGQIGDPRAVEPLLDALRHPRPVEAGPGAAGYASSEPVGQVAALEALGQLGEHATIAIPEIVEILSLPIETVRNERRFAAATGALAGIGDPRVIPELIEHLGDDRRRESVARAIGAFGPEANLAAPTLIALVERSPDAVGNEATRRAVAQILGGEAARELPPNYGAQLIRLTRHVGDSIKRHGCPRGGLHIHGAKERFTRELNSGTRLVVVFDRAPWAENGTVSGRIEPVRADTTEVERRFDSLEAFVSAVDSLLEEYCGAGTSDLARHAAPG